jgi:TolB-like protein/AraC-like DNA-binding protein
MSLLDQLQQVLEAHYHDEQLSVDTLASKLNMSRSHLHRKLKLATGQPANQFIREYRLKRAMLLLQKGDINVSEVAFQVGFGSASYFTSCFTNFYGYPPGEVKHKIGLDAQPLINKRQVEKRDSKRKIFALASVILLLIVAGIFYLNRNFLLDERDSTVEKSIAILPFKNLNTDKENMYFSEGVTEAINRHLSQIGNIKLVSLTSTARYNGSDKSAFEIGEELKVSNILEGSIQRYENTIRIEVRLIDANSERQIWAKNYDRQLDDIFLIQTQIAEEVTLALKSKLTPQERKLLTKDYTANAEAYDLYLKGLFEYRTFFSRKGIH